MAFPISLFSIIGYADLKRPRQYLGFTLAALPRHSLHVRGYVASSFTSSYGQFLLAGRRL